MIFYLETGPFNYFTPESATFYEAVHQHNWLHPDNRHDCIEGKTAPNTILPLISRFGVEGIVPVGSVEFVQDVCTTLLGIPPVKALNIPPELRCNLYLRRLVWDNQTAGDLQKLYERYGPLLVKPGKTPKLFEMVKYTGRETFPEGEPLFVSQPLTQRILSEWRVFCLNGRIVSLYPYGDAEAWEMPDKDLVEEMCQQVSPHSCPSFAMDVAVLDNCPADEPKTAIIEVHPFISCGLYGFDGPDMLRMAIVAWKHHVRTKKEG